MCYKAPKPGEKLTLPEWNFDGSSTGQARTETSEVLLMPVKFVPDTFRDKPNIIVLCECCDLAVMLYHIYFFVFMCVCVCVHFCTL